MSSAVATSGSTPSGSGTRWVGVPVRGFRPRLMILFPFGELGCGRRPHRASCDYLCQFECTFVSVTLKQRLQALAPGLTPRAVLEKLATIQMLDVCLPTTDGRCLIMPRYTQPEPDQALMLHQLNLSLPSQPPPRLKAQEELAKTVQPKLKM